MGNMRALALALILAGCGSALETARADTVPIVSAFYRCVRGSAASQMIALSKARQPRGSAIAEMAFLACQTEEGAIRNVAANAGLSSLEARSIMTNHKMALKQEIVSANPSPLTRR